MLLFLSTSLRILFVSSLAIFTVILFGIMAFLKINGRPFHYFLLTIGQTLKKPGLRVWNKELSQAEIKMMLKKGKNASEVVLEPVPQKILPKSRLSEMSLIVNTGGVYRGEDYEDADFMKNFRIAKA